MATSNHRDVVGNQQVVGFDLGNVSWLVVFGHPSEKYESQLGWYDIPKSYGKIKIMATKPPSSVSFALGTGWHWYRYSTSQAEYGLISLKKIPIYGGFSPQNLHL